MSEGLTGGCLCGAIRYRITEQPHVVGNCYCEDCRRSSGTSHCTHLVIPESGFEITGTPASFDKPADSGNIVTRFFCPTCGSALYSRNSRMPGVVFPRASSLDDPEVAVPQMTVYAAKAPSWAPIDRSKPVFDGMPPEMPEGVPG